MRRALVVEQPGSISLVERPSLAAGPGEVVVQAVYCGLCGTDLELRDGKVDPAYVRYPLTLGHEWSGVVREVGADVTGLEVDDHCVVEGIVPCGSCASCRAGATNVCDVYDELGFTREGGASDEVLVDAHLVHRLGRGVSLLDAALVEPMSVVMRGLERVAPRPGDRALVIGDGTIGLLSAHLLRLWSPAAVELLGRRPEQQQLAERVGVGRFHTDESAAGGGFDLAVEAAGAPEAVVAALRAVRRGGRVALLGLPPAGHVVPVPGDLPVNNDLTVVASFGYTSETWRRVVGLLNAGALAPAQIVTHRFPLDRFERAFQALADPRGPRGKVVLEIGAAEGVA